MGKEEITAFLTHLAVERDVAASTQNQALSTILFLYKKVLKIEPGWIDELVRAKRPQRLPVVLPRETVLRLLGQLSGSRKLMAYLIYGSGLRLIPRSGVVRRHHIHEKTIQRQIKQAARGWRWRPQPARWRYRPQKALVIWMPNPALDCSRGVATRNPPSTKHRAQRTTVQGAPLAPFSSASQASSSKSLA